MKYYAQTICGGIIPIRKLGYRKFRSQRRFPINENKHHYKKMTFWWWKRIFSLEVFCHKTKMRLKQPHTTIKE